MSSPGVPCSGFQPQWVWVYSGLLINLHTHPAVIHGGISSCTTIFISFTNFKVTLLGPCPRVNILGEIPELKMLTKWDGSEGTVEVFWLAALKITWDFLERGEGFGRLCQHESSCSHVCVSAWLAKMVIFNGQQRDLNSGMWDPSQDHRVGEAGGIPGILWFHPNSGSLPAWFSPRAGAACASVG